MRSLATYFGIGAVILSASSAFFLLGHRVVPGSGFSGYVTNPDFSPLSENEAVSFYRDEEDVPVVAIQGPLIVFSPTIKVDTTASYQYSVEVRVHPKPDGSPQEAKIFAGLATLDQRGDMLTSGPGTYRYAASQGTDINSENGWVLLEGIISGEGDDNHNQFRPGTASVRKVVVVNLGGDYTVQTEIRDIKLVPDISGGPT